MSTCSITAMENGTKECSRQTGGALRAAHNGVKQGFIDQVKAAIEMEGQRSVSACAPLTPRKRFVGFPPRSDGPISQTQPAHVAATKSVPMPIRSDVDSLREESERATVAASRLARCGGRSPRTVADRVGAGSRDRIRTRRVDRRRPTCETASRTSATANPRQGVPWCGVHYRNACRRRVRLAALRWRWQLNRAMQAIAAGKGRGVVIYDYVGRCAASD